MKKILFALSVLTLLSYGCNRDQDKESTGTGMQQEEARSQDVQRTGAEDTDLQNMDKRIEGEGTQQ